MILLTLQSPSSSKDNLLNSEKVNFLRGELHRARTDVDCLVHQLPAKTREDVAQREVEELKLRYQRLEIKLRVRNLLTYLLKK